MKIKYLLSILALAFTKTATSFPGAPQEAAHPGSKIYSYGFEERKLKCSGRDVIVYLPTSVNKAETFPAVIYGHGQALGIKNYKATLEHLAKKGIAAIFPTYDTGFFDQDWDRMAEDYINLSECAIREVGKIDDSKVVFSGHSKGAYVASVAAGRAFKKNIFPRPGSVVLFGVAGVDESMLALMDPEVEMTVVFSDADTVVKRELSETTYRVSPSHKKQFIFVKSYPADSGKSIKADHFWPLTQGSIVGGGPESELHYYGSWKWLVAAAWDLSSESGAGTQEFLYGARAAEKGVRNLTDDIRRSW